MAQVIVPELAESISEGTIAQWLKQPGDYVEKGEYLVELETDKVNVELTADYSGVLKDVVKDSGDTVQVGEVIAEIDENGGASSGEEQKLLRQNLKNLNKKRKRKSSRNRLHL